MLSLLILTIICCKFYLCNTQTLDLSNWMQQKSNNLWNKTLLELTLPGTHDSGAYNLSHNIMPGSEPHFEDVIIDVAQELGLPVDEVVILWSKAQPYNLYYQLLNGSRYIDMRCGLWNVTNSWHTYH